LRRVDRQFHTGLIFSAVTPRFIWHTSPPQPFWRPQLHSF